MTSPKYFQNPPPAPADPPTFAREGCDDVTYYANVCEPLGDQNVVIYPRARITSSVFIYMLATSREISPVIPELQFGVDL